VGRDLTSVSTKALPGQDALHVGAALMYYMLCCIVSFVKGARGMTDQFTYVVGLTEAI
jgi:hypothetical protein